MTCGVCNPEAFRSALGVGENARVFGYTCSSNPQGDIRSLYFNGAGFVMFDAPGRLPITSRPAMRRLTKVCRPGDMVVLASAFDVGSKRTTQDGAIARLEGLGLQVRILTHEGRARPALNISIHGSLDHPAQKAAGNQHIRGELRQG